MSSLARWPDKDPNEHLDYVLDWDAVLRKDKDTIISSAWEVPAGLTKTSQTNTATQAVVWLGGGTAGAVYPCLNRVTTALGRIMDRTVLLGVVES